MKKTYITPATVCVEIKANTLLVQYSNTEAGSNATVLSRGNRSSWDDEEE